MIMDEKQPRLSRQVRGQVRRATNRLLALERRSFPSRSDPSKEYVAMIMPGGLATCNCRGWVTKKDKQPRQCVHVFTMIGRRGLWTDEEHLFLTDYLTTQDQKRPYYPVTESRIYRQLLTTNTFDQEP